MFAWKALSELVCRYRYVGKRNSHFTALHKKMPRACLDNHTRQK
nr:hypothetical protein [uncultured bacterium]